MQDSLSRYERAQHRVYEIVSPAASGDSASRVFDLAIFFLIALNVLAVILETVRSLSEKYSALFTTLEFASITIFSIEYVLRIWSCIQNPRYADPISGRFRLMATPLLLVDLLAILPSYVPMIIPLDLRFLRAIRLLRLFRIAKVARYSIAFETLGRVLKSKAPELQLTLFGAVILLVIASGLMYSVENSSQPDRFSSIPATMWWAVATLTTVGYGDVYPVTPLGRFLGAVVAIAGVGLFALPAGIVASGFADEIRSRTSPPRRCPHCGGRLED